MSAATFLAALARRRRQHDLLWIASIVVVAGAMAWLGVGRVVGSRGGAVALIAVALGAGLATAWRRRAAWSVDAAAGLAEARTPGLDNLLVTAAAAEHMATLAPAIRDEIVRQADARVAAIEPRAIVPLRRPALTALTATVLAVAVIAVPVRPRSTTAFERASGAADGAATLAVEITVTPPSYLRLAANTVSDPSDVVVPAGGTVRLVVRTSLGAVSLTEAGGDAAPLVRGAEPGTFERTWTPETSTTCAIAAGAGDGAATVTRLVAITVTPDARPTVRVSAPGRDVRLPAADAPIPLVVEATDDHAVTGLELRWVRMSGSGESFTFGEGRVPIVDVTREGATLRGRLSWSLAPLGLEAGESLVYRVVARDDAPGAPPGESESYTVDIGAAFETSGAGAALADEDRRYAISQQMVIVHTERAVAAQRADSADAWLTRTQGIAAEQRMVRAEVVFLGGGEVEDEVEEAAHGDELQEGRLENRGRAEMLRALGEMSRAEARLVAGDARGALVFERRALTALLAAFDRRRYFLRTVPERSRIDLTRRLSGDRRLAAPALRARPERADALASERALLLELAAVDPTRPVPAALAARVAALGSGTPPWPALAGRLVAATDATARREVVRAIGAALGARATTTRASARGDVARSRDVLDGLLAEERRKGTRP